MKLKPEHLDHIARAIAAKFTTANIEHLAKRYAANGLSSERFNWDVAHAAGLTSYFCFAIYPYANDNHISTALRHIMKGFGQ